MIFPDYTNVSLLDVKFRVTQLENLNKPEEDFIYVNVADWQCSDKRKTMLKAQDYYNNKNDIIYRERYYIDRQGVKRVAENLSNSKLAHPFMQELVDQKVNYMLGKEPTFQTDNDRYGEALGTYFDKKFIRKLRNVNKDAIINGLAWLQVYYNEQGVLSFKRIPTEEVIPFWADTDHTQLQAVIRVYDILKFGNKGEKTTVHKIEYYTLNGVYFYVMGEKGLEPDLDKSQPTAGHFTVTQPLLGEDGKPWKDENGEQLYEDAMGVWEKVPFIAFKYNSDERSLLTKIKALVDNYDITSSDTSNHLQDVPNSIKIVRNYDGADKGEFVQNLATFRTAFVSADGDVSALNTPLDTQAIDSHLNRLKKDIYEAGSGVDTQEANVGVASGVALKLRYAGLENDVLGIATEFIAAFEELLWFIKTDLIRQHVGDFTNEEVDVLFNTDMVINEQEVISNAKNSVGLISKETILANHPWVKDSTQELAELKKEEEEAIKQQQELMGDNLGFGNLGKEA